MTKTNSALRFNHAKQRVAKSASEAWRFYDDSGEDLPVDELREDFDEATSEIKTLTELWSFLSQPLKQRVRGMFEDPAVDVIDSDGTSWSSIALYVIRQLDSGEKIEFANLSTSTSLQTKGRSNKRSR